MSAARHGVRLEPARRVGQGEGKGPMERVIDPLANGLGNGIGWLADHGVLFAVFAVLWVGFIAALVVSHGSLDQAWDTLRSWPPAIQAVVWLLFLPVVGGLWVWETAWPFLTRIIVVLALAWFNLIVLLPKAAGPARP